MGREMTRLYVEFTAAMVASYDSVVATLREAERQGLEILCMSQQPPHQTRAALIDKGIMEYFDEIVPVVGFIVHENNMSPLYIATLKDGRRSMWAGLHRQLSSDQQSSNPCKEDEDGDSEGSQQV